MAFNANGCGGFGKALLCTVVLSLAVTSMGEEQWSTGWGDPILTDFSGRIFEFFGHGESHYNLFSSASVQINMHLFEALSENHIGTYMDNYGFSFNQLRVLVSLADQEGDIIVQSWNDKHIPQATTLVSGEAKNQTLASGNNGAVQISTEPWRPFTGRTVNLITETVGFSVWSTPAGVVDSFGVSQPAYLNFNITLFSAPEGGEVEGIIGESLQRVSDSTASQQAASNPFSAEARSESPIKAAEDAYVVSGIFGTDFAFNRFSQAPKVAASATSRRSLLAKTENPYVSLQFPLRATSAK